MRWLRVMALLVAVAVLGACAGKSSTAGSATSTTTVGPVPSDPNNPDSTSSHWHAAPRERQELIDYSRSHPSATP